ncbi:hypothetical protein D3C81_1150090 [compost metagenome]
MPVAAGLTNLGVEVLQQQHGPRRHRTAGLLAAQGRDLATPAGQLLADLLVAILAQATGATHQLDGVVLGNTFGDPVAAVGIADAAEHMDQFMHQRAGAVFTDQRAVAVHVQRIGRGQTAAPHRVAGADDQQFVRLAGKHRLGVRPDEGQQGEDVHAPHALAHRRGHRHVGLAQGSAPGAELAGQDPAGGAVEQPLWIVDAETILADPWPAGFHALPALGQLELQARNQLDVVLHIDLGRRHQIVAAQQRPVRGHAGVEAAIGTRVADLHPVGQLRLAFLRAPDPVLGTALLPLALGLEVAVIAFVAEAEVQVPQRLAALQGEGDLGLVAVRQEAHPIIHVDPLRRSQRRGKPEQQHRPRCLEALEHDGISLCWAVG